MKLDAALDTSASTTAICVVNSRDGTIVLETTVPTDPKAIFGCLNHSWLDCIWSLQRPLLAGTTACMLRCWAVL